ncbi:MAG: type II secretion system F family protein [Desulfobacteraceae bacterium]
MNYYRYKLITADGQIDAGIAKLPYKETMSAVNHLERNGAVTLYVKKLKGLTQWPFRLAELRPQRRLSRTLIAELLNNLSLMLKSGLPMVTALEEAAQTEDYPKVARDFEEIIERIKGGSSFSDAAQRHPHIFPQNVIYLIRMGEDTGNLDQMLKDAADHLLRIEKIVSDTKQALLYPCFVLAAISGGLLFWFAYVVPKIVSLFRELDVTLPALTVFLIKCSEFFQAYYLHIIISGIAMIVITGVLRRRSRRIRKGSDLVLLRIPIAKSIITASALAYISEYFAMLINAGIDILHSIGILSNSVTNAVYQDKLGEVKGFLENGEGISDSFKEAGIFPNFVVRMMSVGEYSGTLSEQLNYIAEQYRNKLSILVSTIGKSIEPLILMVAGAIFAVVIIGLFLPIYDLVSQVSAF